MTDLKLVVFDVDGTLVDSQNDIQASMELAFETCGLNAPARGATLAIVGLSLDVAMRRLAPDASTQVQADLVEAYKASFAERHRKLGSREAAPLYPGALEALKQLHGRDEVLLGVATGKSRRGLDRLLDGHDLRRFFVTTQVADNHPSKPHPSMLQQALADTGVASQNAVMVGDTTFDIDMAHGAGMKAIGVGWGYHSTQSLAHAEAVVNTFADLPAALGALWRAT